MTALAAEFFTLDEGNVRQKFSSRVTAVPVPVNSYKSTAATIIGLKTGDLSVRHWFTSMTQPVV